jgi:uncharacterized Zn finger protein
VAKQLYISCTECGEEYTPESLVEKHLAILKDMGVVAHPQDRDPDKIFACPECTHDF